MSRHLLALALAAAILAPAPAMAQEQDARTIKLNQIAEAIKAQVEAKRGLKFKHDVPKGVQTKEQLQKFLSSEFKKSMPQEKIDKYNHALSKVGLIPEGLDIGKLMLNVLSENIGGFYNPQTQRLYLIAAQAPGKQTAAEKSQRAMLKMLGLSQDHMVMAHELTHALDDQHFPNLLGLDLDKMTNEDWTLSIKCLIEGTANIVMYDWLMGRVRPGMDSQSMMNQDLMQQALGSMNSGAIGKAPNYVKYGLVAPYMIGMKFVGAIKARGGWDAVNKAYADPPSSMEQILHPEKYFERDHPTHIRLPGFARLLKKSGYERVARETLGELYMQVLLSDQTGDARAAKAAAAGWDGDAYVVYRNAKTGNNALVLMATFDTDADAKEFADSYEKVIAKKYPKARGENRSWTDASGQIRLWTEGKHVYVLESVPADITDALVKQFDKAKLTEHAGGAPKVGQIERKPATSATTPATPAAKPGLGFGFTAPKGWTAKTDTDSDYPLTLSGPSGAKITVGVLETEMGLRKIGKLIERVLPSKLRGYKRLEFSLKGLPYDAHQIFYTGTKDDEPRSDHFSQIVVKGDGGGMYLLLLTTRAATVEVDNAAFAKFAHAFKPRR